MKRGRNAKACVACRITKTRCNYALGSTECDKCLSRGIPCTMYTGPLGAHGKQPVVGDQSNTASASASATATATAATANATAPNKAVQPPTQTQTHSPVVVHHGPGLPHAVHTPMQPHLQLGDHNPGGIVLSSITGSKPPTPPMTSREGPSVQGFPGKDYAYSEKLVRLEANVTEILGSIRASSMMGRSPAGSDHKLSPENPSVSSPDMSRRMSEYAPPAPAAHPDAMLKPTVVKPDTNHHMETYSIVSRGTSSGDAAASASRSKFPRYPMIHSHQPQSLIPEDFAHMGVLPSEQMNMSSMAAPELQVSRALLASDAISSSSHRFRFRESSACFAMSALANIQGFGQYTRLMEAMDGNISGGPKRGNIVTDNILSIDQVISLFTFFRDNYNHWVSLPNVVDVRQFVTYLLEKCSLLVTTCCSVALRFGSTELWTAVYPHLVGYMWQELSATMSETPQTIECLQALTILSKFADSLSYGDYNFDMWHLSALGLEHLETVASVSGTFSHLHLRLWNHLCLAQANSAVATGRRSFVSSRGIALARRIVSLPNSTRFDSCMVAELEIESLAYGYLSYYITYEKFQEQVAQWWEEWRYLTWQPLIQFVEPVYLYLKFIVRATHVYRMQGASAQDDQMHNANILDLAISVMDPASLTSDLIDLTKVSESLLEVVHESFFPCLSDQLHHMGFTAAVMALLVSRSLRTTIAQQGAKGSSEATSAVSNAIRVIRRLASRYSSTSHGRTDISQRRGNALTELGAQLDLF